MQLTLPFDFSRASADPKQEAPERHVGFVVILGYSQSD